MNLDNKTATRLLVATYVLAGTTVLLLVATGWLLRVTYDYTAWTIRTSQVIDRAVEDIADLPQMAEALNAIAANSQLSADAADAATGLLRDVTRELAAANDTIADIEVAVDDIETDVAAIRSDVADIQKDVYHIEGDTDYLVDLLVHWGD